MDTRLLVLTLLSMLIAGATRALNEDLPAFRSIGKPARALILSALGIAGGAIDKMVAGSSFGQAGLAVLMIAGPGFFVLLFEAVGGGGGGGGDSGKRASYSASSRPAPFVDVKLAPCVIIRPDRYRFNRAVSALFMAVVLAGCGAGLTKFILAADNATDILAALYSAAELYFKQHPDAEKEKAFTKDFQDASLALAAVKAGLQAASDISAGKADASFNDFRDAYTALSAFMRDTGIVEAQAGKLMARRGDRMVPIAPVAMEHL